MTSYLKNNILLFILIIVLSIILTYYRQGNIKLEKQLENINYSISEYRKYIERISGKEIGKIKLYCLTTGNEIEITPNYNYIIFGSNKGCKKCLADIFEGLNKLTSREMPIVILSANSIMEFLPYKEIIMKSSNIYWDKNDSMLSLLGEDRKNSPPVLIKIKKGLIVQYNLFDKLSIVDDIR